MYTNIKNIREIKNNELDSKRFIQDPLNYTVNSGIYESKNNSNNSELDSKRYIQDALNSEVYTNKKKSSNLANIYDDLDTRKFIKNNIKYEVNSGYNLQTKDGEYIHSQLINKNNRPTAPAYTNNLGYTRNNTDNTVVLDKEILKNPINTNKADYCKDPYIINSANENSLEYAEDLKRLDQNQGLNYDDIDVIIAIIKTYMSAINIKKTFSGKQTRNKLKTALAEKQLVQAKLALAFQESELIAKQLRSLYPSRIRS